MQYQANMAIESATVKQIQRFHDAPRINHEVASTEEHMPSMNEPDKTNIITTRKKTTKQQKRCTKTIVCMCQKKQRSAAYREHRNDIHNIQRPNAFEYQQCFACNNRKSQHQDESRKVPRFVELCNQSADAIV